MRKFASFLTAVSVAAALGLSAGMARADVKAGVDAWQRGDFTGAVAEWRPLADKGDADAQYNLGQAYKMGRGVPAGSRISPRPGMKRPRSKAIRRRPPISASSSSRRARGKRRFRG